MWCQKQFAIFRPFVVETSSGWNYETMSEDYVSSKRKRWVVQVSKAAENTFNPIRDVVDSMKIVTNPDYELIKLTVGDPTVFGNLPPNERCVEAFCDKIKSGEDNGYHLAHGCLKAREAVARYCSTPKTPVSAEDVVLSSGCSGAIDLAIDVLTNPGDNILIPRPGFSLYKCLSGSKGIETRSYKLMAERCWEADLEHMESLIDHRTKVIIVVNPSNPCGSVYTKEHLQDILAVAEKHQLPIISDEVYAFCTFRDRQFYSIGPLSKTVPVLTIGGIAKRFLVPGWRLGWVVIHDRNEAFGHEVKAGLRRLCQRILGPCAPLQAALPVILKECKPDFFEKTLTLMKKVSDIFYNTLSRVPELYPVKPYGSMYMLVGVNIDRLRNIKNDVEFTQRLLSEKSVFCLPAKCFECPNFFRVVLTCPENIAQEACVRIADFCKNHRIPRAPSVATNGMMNAQNGH